MATAAKPPAKSVLITGGAKRVGRALALDLADHGWSVAVHYNTSQADAEETVAALHAKHVHAMAFDADLTNEEHVQGLIQRVCEGMGTLSALINNASVFENDNIASATRESWDKHMEANLRAPFLLSQHFAQQLPEVEKGVIVNILDQRLFKPTPQFLSYGVSRAGLHWLTTVLAQALAPRIRVNAVAPGPTLRNPRQSEAHFKRQQEATVLGKGASVDEVAKAVRYLISARAVTGETIAVDGGQHLIWKTADVTGTEP